MRTTLAGLLSVPILLTGCTTLPGSTTFSVAAALQEFDDCGELLTYFQDNAASRVGAYGFGFGYGYGGPLMAMEDSSGGVSVASGDASSAPQPGRDFSGTNTQEVGVDEADVVKTDGTIIVSAVGGRVRVVDVATGTVLSTVSVGGDQSASELLLDGSTLVVLSTQWNTFNGWYADTLGPAFPTSRTVVTTVDLSDPAAPRTLGSARIEGSYRSARMIEGVVRLVLVSEPTGLTFTYPKDGSLNAEDDALEANRAAVADSDIDDWVPHVQFTDADGNTGDTQQLVGCDDISRPAAFSGLSTLSVLTLDLSQGGIEPSSTTGLVASGDLVYASTDRLVVGTTAWPTEVWDRDSDAMIAPWGMATSTDLHSFDISSAGDTTYQASGTVQGHLLNQFAIDEQDGVFRVATTRQDNGSGGASESSLVVLAERDGSLVTTGQVDGLGKGEQIQSVRYLSADLAAVVTFRQVDPLYLIDTSDPADPAVAGELKIPGYSAYLHPLDGDRLLGIGQDADVETGQTRGLQASVFDISDPDNPRRTSQVIWKDAHSGAEWDHRAFTYWPATGQLFLPAEMWSQTDSGNFTGVLSAQVDGAEVTKGAQRSLGDKDSWAYVQRTIVIGDDLWVLTEADLVRCDLATLDTELTVSLAG